MDISRVVLLALSFFSILVIEDRVMEHRGKNARPLRIVPLVIIVFVVQTRLTGIVQAVTRIAIIRARRSIIWNSPVLRYVPLRASAEVGHDFSL
jgi:hypothetical protein